MAINFISYIIPILSRSCGILITRFSKFTVEVLKWNNLEKWQEKGAGRRRSRWRRLWMNISSAGIWESRQKWQHPRIWHRKLWCKLWRRSRDTPGTLGSAVSKGESIRILLNLNASVQIFVKNPWRSEINFFLINVYRGQNLFSITLT